MAVERVIMPKLGVYLEDVLLSAWRVEEGAEVVAGTVVLEMETDKTTAEVEAESAGWLHRLVAADSTVPIGTTVGLIAETRDEYDRLVAEGVEPTEESASADAPHRPGPAVTASASRPSGGKPPLVSPRARALLKNLGLTAEDAREITGTGPGGRVLDSDVAAWAERRDTTAAQSGPTVQVHDGEVVVAVAETIPLRGRRGTIAARMVSSLQTAAQLTSVLEIDVKPLVELRRDLNAGGATPPIGITSIVVALVSAALRAHPLLNARVTESAVELLADVNVAVAVDTPEGLIAPVVHHADRLSVAEVNARIVELAERARAGTLTPVDVAGGTFTVSNGGIHRVDITTAILNPPQSAILWIGRIRDRPVVVDEGIAVRPTLQACLTYDHRAVDGARAAEFLAMLEELVADLPRLPT